MRRGFVVIQPVAVKLTARSSRALFQRYLRDVTGLYAAPLALEGSKPVDSVAENNLGATIGSGLAANLLRNDREDPQLLTVGLSFLLGQPWF